MKTAEPPTRDRQFMPLRPSATGHPAYILGLSCVPESASLSRIAVSTTLACWGLDKLTDDAMLITCELVTNAVTHTGQPLSPLQEPGRCRLYIERIAPGRVRISVTDTSPRRPRRRAAGDDEENGRGLTLVAILAARWDTIPTKTGKTVWAEIEAAA